jgi:hypothetical protein
MEITEQTLQQVGRVVKKIVDKFPSTEEASMLTDIHLCVSQETGEITVYDDDETEITRCVIEQWIEAKDDDFFDQVEAVLRKVLKEQAQSIETMSILKPYAFVLEDEEHDEQRELYVVDDETVILDPILMEDLGKDLDAFFEKIMQDV